MSSQHFNRIESRDCRGARFEIKRTPTGELIVDWRYSLPQGTRFAALLFIVILVMFGVIWFGNAVQLPYPFWIIMVGVGGIPLVIAWVLAIAVAVDPRSERLIFHENRLEHVPHTIVAEMLFNCVEPYRDVQNQGTPWKREPYCQDGVPVDVLDRREITRMRFDIYGEGPECLVLGAKKLMCIGPYLHPDQLRTIALAIQAWMRGADNQTVAAQLIQRLSDFSSRFQESRTPNMKLWTKLIASPPTRCTVLDPAGQGEETVVLIRGVDSVPGERVLLCVFLYLMLCIAGFAFSMTAIDNWSAPKGWIAVYAVLIVGVAVLIVLALRSASTRLRFSQRGFEYEHTFVQMKDRHAIGYDEVEQVRQVYGNNLHLHLTGKPVRRLSTFDVEVTTWIGKLIAARAGVAIWRSKLCPRGIPRASPNRPI